MYYVGTSLMPKRINTSPGPPYIFAATNREIRYPKSNFRVTGISQKMGWLKLERRFCQIVAIFDDLPKFFSTFSAFIIPP